MTDLPETGTWPAGITQLETNHPVVGGPPDEGTGAGRSNIPLAQLARRTKLLKSITDAAWTGDNSIRQLTASGYQRLGDAGGLLVQWGRAITSTDDVGDGGTLVTFPMAFPTACFVILATDYRPSGATTEVQMMSPGVVTKTQFRMIAQNDAGLYRATDFMYVALGH